MLPGVTDRASITCAECHNRIRITHIGTTFLLVLIHSHIATPRHVLGMILTIHSDSFNGDHMILLRTQPSTLNRSEKGL